jgi:hypothetical protein
MLVIDPNVEPRPGYPGVVTIEGLDDAIFRLLERDG